MEVYRKARQYDAARGTLKVWLLQFAYHRSINRRNYLVLRHYYKANLEEAANWESIAPVRPPFFTQEAVELAHEVLATLSDSQQRTIRMVFFQGMTLKEVAEQTKESLSNVRNHYYRGLDRLRLSSGCGSERICSTCSIIRNSARRADS
jgi:RNA polymerase sigma-70 factor (ECF subfamily)